MKLFINLFFFLCHLLDNTIIPKGWRTGGVSVEAWREYCWPHGWRNRSNRNEAKGIYSKIFFILLLLKTDFSLCFAEEIPRNTTLWSRDFVNRLLSLVFKFTLVYKEQHMARQIVRFKHTYVCVYSLCLSCRCCCGTVHFI